jgi:hypothetical protein
VASNLLKHLEDLYAYCLQYGLITYGFAGKIAQEQIGVIQRARQQTEAAAHKMLMAVKRHESELANRLDAFGKSLVQAEAAFNTAVTERLGALQPSIDGLADLLAAGQSDSTKLGDFLTAVTADAAAAEKARADLQTAVELAMTDLTTDKAMASEELSAVQSLGKQVQGFQSDAKAMLEGVTDARAKIMDQMTQITAFYSEIEEHRAAMTEARKEAQSHLTSLRESSEKLVGELSDRTGQVVQTNESLIDQIKDHLRKAIGASLFTAFDTRRRHIYAASWVWGGLLLLSVGGIIWFAVSFVTHLAEFAKADVHPALLYARLVIVAPLAFLVAFTSKQYARERRAEEEYAFKSAISVSLDSYRDLIARMKKEGHDATLVERLVLEIFDNPAKRLYAEPHTKVEKDGHGIWDLMNKALDKIPKAG